MHVHHQGQYITFHRMNVKSGKGWYLIARMKFSDNDDPNETLPPVVLNQSTCSLRFSSGALKATSSLTLESINSVLYRSEPEEYDVSAGEGGAYIIPNFGKPVYCGLQGWVSVLRKKLCFIMI
ncbi:AFH_G0023310.mRNA.1.CDS.1 [Saccharomyces cerevisiae]|nr:AFH_G0023310.mRNA.1.CDS.1 [Saccharomyces cerevisiae]CAI6726403.1 AFH_G0023310.mRNA.1.CDS.1 [Saccharomyces cerevisiae]